MNSISLIVLDVDGVLTDGKLYISSDGTEYKSFHTQDGMGITLAHYTGIKSAIITGRKSESVTKRANELNIHYVYQGVNQKLEILHQILNELNISMNQVCYIGDDINDLPIIKEAGFSAAPNNAVEIVKKHVHYVASLNGGEGAVREVIDTLLQREYDYQSLVDKFLYTSTLAITQ